MDFDETGTLTLQEVGAGLSDFAWWNDHSHYYPQWASHLDRCLSAKSGERRASRGAPSD